jgi:hypothetical protein
VIDVGDELLVCRAPLAAMAAWAMARQRTPMLRKANVPFGEVLREACRERRRMKRRAARLATIKKTRKASTVTTTWRAKTARTVAGTEVKDICKDIPPWVVSKMIERW